MAQRLRAAHAVTATMRFGVSLDEASRMAGNDLPTVDVLAASAAYVVAVGRAGNHGVYGGCEHEPVTRRSQPRRGFVSGARGFIPGQPSPMTGPCSQSPSTAAGKAGIVQREETPSFVADDRRVAVAG